MSNIVRAKVTIRGNRPLIQHQFGPDAIPIEKGERTGVAGNDPEEWKKTCMLTKDGQLYIRGDYVFSCLCKGAVHTKKGRGSIQSLVQSTLQVEDSVILLNRHVPESGPQADPTQEVYLDVRGVRNPQSKARNVRYRLATAPGWECSFTLLWDKTIVSREQMKAVLRDSGTLGGLGDGIKIGCGRFAVLKYEEIGEDDAEGETAEGDLGEDAATDMEPRRRKVRALQGSANSTAGAH